MAEKASGARGDQAGVEESASVEKAEPPRDEEQPFPVERAIREARAFAGVPSHVMAGALHGYRRKTISREDAKALAKEWLTKEVEQS